MLSIDLLLENEEELNKDLEEKQKDITIKRFEDKFGKGNGDIKIRTITASELFDCQKRSRGKTSDIGGVYNLAKEVIVKGLIYPNLKDEKLLKSRGCHKAVDVIEKIFKPQEITDIADEIMDFSDLGDAESRTIKEVEIIKN